MKKFFLLAAMAGVALTGCVKTESEVAVKSDSNRIVFDNPVVSYERIFLCVRTA